MMAFNPIKFTMNLPPDINLNGGVEWFDQTRDEDHVKNDPTVCRNARHESGQVELHALEPTHCAIDLIAVAKCLDLHG